MLGVACGLAVALGVAVLVGVTVAVEVAVGVGVGVRVAVAVAVRLGVSKQQTCTNVCDGKSLAGEVKVNILFVGTLSQPSELKVLPEPVLEQLPV